ncbi:hypothetical protein LTR37_015924 [Vermiconidia calcicola]|uniref:Uncharacterized protein n=1 Tax=Vermiconidia calcicola TaxID=1690605 RepID=A0ACC3MPM0_9PEZI|nr:hypothetical protein LTR37_015924 [Vermiconidia calcicola]
MAELEDILASDLGKLTAEDLRSRSFIKLKDPENLTAEDVDKLRALVNGLDNSRPLDLGALDKKLRDCTQAAPTSPRSRSSLSPTPDANDPVNIEALFQENLLGEHKAYHDIIQDGGRPSHPPDDASFDILKEPGEYANIISYWTNGWPDRRCILQAQWSRWKDFRQYQDRKRKRFWKSEWFEKYVEHVRDYRREKGIEGDVCLLQNRKEQSRFDDWKEFHYWEHTKADRSIKEMVRAAGAKKACESQLQTAIDEGQAADRIEWVKEQGVAAYEARRGTAEIELERQAVLLEWIGEQLPIIASECASSYICSDTRDDCQSTSIRTKLGKRKRLTEESAHMKICRRKVADADPHNSAVPLATNTDERDSTLYALPQRKAGRTSRHQRSRNTHQEAHAVLSPTHRYEGSKPSQKKPSPKPAKSSRSRSYAKLDLVQTKSEQLSIQAGSNTRTSATAHDSERGLLRPACSSPVFKAQTRGRKARGGEVRLSSPGNNQGCDGQPQSRQDEVPGKISTTCKNTVPRVRTNLRLASKPVRRSQRISQRPPVHYSK